LDAQMMLDRDDADLTNTEELAGDDQRNYGPPLGEPHGQSGQRGSEFSPIPSKLVSFRDCFGLSRWLVKHGAPRVSVLEVSEALPQQQVVSRGMVVSLGGSAGSIRRVPFRSGGYTLDVLAEPDYGETELGKLLSSGAATHGDAAEAR